MAFAVAIDGPAGAGKSTVAKIAAEQLKFIYVDTGAMYRAVAVYFMNNRIDINNEDAVNEAVDGADIGIEYENGVQQVILNGQNVTSSLRDEDVGRCASTVSKYASVRGHLLELQRALAARADVIMDGRDIGTTVLPGAQVKIYLTASVEARAKRRYDELISKGTKADIDEIKADIERRDYQDMNRDISPLRQAEDAVFLDTSDMNIEQVINEVKNLVAQA